MKVALDAMGGDYAPHKIVCGAVEALKQFKDLAVTLIGKKKIIEKELLKYQHFERLDIIDAPEEIEMYEAPARAIRNKKDSSIVKGMDLIKNKKADAFISAGNTGAVMAGGLFKVGRIKGIKRPSILINFPSIKGQTIVMDNGANADCKPENLLEFAIMGQVYSRKVNGVDKPRIGLLSIGEEKEKGNQLVKDSYQLIAKDFRITNFIGNVEGRDIFNGRCDLVICDGFVGNIVLKTTEGTASYMFELLKEAFNKDLRAKLGAFILKPYLKKMKDKVDYRQYGGAPLLGIDGVVIISHGSSDEIAIINAIKVARKTYKEKIVELIKQEVKSDGE